jgi:hypothetical protein
MAFAVWIDKGSHLPLCTNHPFLDDRRVCAKVRAVTLAAHLIDELLYSLPPTLKKKEKDRKRKKRGNE